MAPALSAAIVAIAAALVITSGVAAPLERLAQDALVRIGAQQPPEPPADLPDVALVVIDPQSVRALPDWPWPRSVYAQAVRRLDAAGAKVIAIDIDFSAARGQSPARMRKKFGWPVEAVRPPSTTMAAPVT